MGRLQLMIRAPMPLMDHLISHENRLWGCRYGKDHDGNFVNEIYASALGDFTVWYRFRGIASDSYVLSLGAEGPFTGAAVVGGYPVFFKENSIHKIYGSDPGSYRLQSVGCVGMAPGSHKSAAMLDHGLIYLGTDGFYRYDGSLPRKISKELDDTERKLLEHLTQRMLMDALIADAALDSGEALAALTLLEVKGLVCTLPGGWVERA